MKTALIIWKDCPAGNNVKNHLINEFNFKKTNDSFDNNPIYQLNDDIKLYTINTKHINAENIDKNIEADRFIFSTTHRSEAGTASFSVHAPGNWNRAEMGGQKREICIAMPTLMKQAYLKLKKQNNLEEFNVTMECTHHGPYLEKPCMFIEIGSTEKQWTNQEAGRIVAQTITTVLVGNKNGNTEKKYEVAFGIGGPHYCNNFNKILERTDIAVGHVCPKYALESLDEIMIKQGVEKSQEKVDFILLDWKGLGKEKQRITELLKKLNIEFKRTDKS